MSEALGVSVRVGEADGGVVKLVAPSTQVQEVVGVSEALGVSVRVGEADGGVVKLVAPSTQVQEVAAVIAVVTVTISLLLSVSDLVSSVHDKAKQKQATCNTEQQTSI